MKARAVLSAVLAATSVGPWLAYGADTATTGPASPPAASQPKPSPIIPMLPKEVQKQTDELNAQIEGLQKEGTYAEAVEVAVKVAGLMRQNLPAGWWEVADADRQVADLRWLASQTPEVAAQLRRAEELNGNGGAAYGAADYGDAELLFRQALEIRRHALPAGHPNTSNTLNNLAAVLYAQDKLAEAEPLYREALGIDRLAFPAGHPGLATDLNNLASLLQAQNKLAEAEPMYREAIEINCHALPAGHPEIAQGLSNLATLLRDQNKLAKAEPLCREALEMRRKALPAGHRDIAQSLNNLAVLLLDQNRLAEAEPLYREALGIYRQAFPAGHPDIATSLNNLAVLLYDQNKLDDAEPFLREAVEIRRKALPAGHPDIASSLNSLARLLQDQNKLAEAEPLFRESLEIRRKALPPGHPALATSLNNLAELLRGQNKLAEAEPLFREALAIDRRAFPARHPSLAIDLNNLAVLLTAESNLAEAEPLFREALEIRRQALPAGDPDIASSLNSLAWLLEDQNKLAEAELMVREALEISRRALPAGHPGIAQSLNNLAELLRGQNKLAEAEPLFREALAIDRRAFPARHPSLAIDLNNLAMLLWAESNLAEAEPLNREALEIKETQRTNVSGDESARASYADQLGLRPTGLLDATVLCGLSRSSEAASVVERVTGRALLDLLARSDQYLITEARQSSDPAHLAVLEKKLADEQSAKVALARTEALLSYAVKTKSADQPTLEVQRKKDQEAVLSAGSSVMREVRSLFPVAKPLTTAEIAAKLPAGSLAISFGWIEGRGGGLVLTTWVDAAGSDAVVLAEKKEPVAKLTAVAQKVREAVLSKDQADWQTPAKELSDLLFVPKVRQAMAKADTLVVVPDGPLSELPLEVLAAADPQGPLAGKKIIYAPSITAYIDRLGKAGKASGATSAVVLGGAVYSREASSTRPTPPSQGALLAAVVPGGPGEKAGLRGGDILIGYGDGPIDDQRTLPKAAAATTQAVADGKLPAGAPVKVKVWRDGKTVETAVPPGKLGVQVAQGNAADLWRSTRSVEDALNGKGAANISAVDQVRLFGGKLSPLPGTTTEAQAVAASLSAKGVTPVVLLGEDATAPKLREKLVGARYVHLATHGLMGTSDRPYDASLALTQPLQATPDDIGFLKLDDLIAKFAGRLDGCEMVVLSACDTGRGQQKGDTVLSLPMGFFFAGTPTVVASLWRVDDNATSLMMARFYDNLLGNYTQDRTAYGRAYKAGTGMTKIDALQEAREWLRTLTQTEADKALEGLGKGGSRGLEAVGPVSTKSVHPYDHPRYWAPFILIGAEK
jgi:CHAT domain-containing protein/tetratricopeptide (TPR) repeat protein